MFDSSDDEYSTASRSGSTYEEEEDAEILELDESVALAELKSSVRRKVSSNSNLQQ